METTPIYNWPTPSLPDSANGPDALDDLARAIETTLNTISSKRVVYSAAISHSAPPVSTSSIGGWVSAGGFVGNSTGITVPEAGIYLAYLSCLGLSRNTVDPRTGFGIGAQGATGCRVPFVVGLVNAACSIPMGLTPGGQVPLFFYNGEASPNLVATMQLTVVKISP